MRRGSAIAAPEDAPPGSTAEAGEASQAPSTAAPEAGADGDGQLAAWTDLARLALSDDPLRAIPLLRRTAPLLGLTPAPEGEEEKAAEAEEKEVEAPEGEEEEEEAEEEDAPVDGAEADEEAPEAAAAPAVPAAGAKSANTGGVPRPVRKPSVPAVAPGPSGEAVGGEAAAAEELAPGGRLPRSMTDPVYRSAVSGAAESAALALEAAAREEEEERAGGAPASASRHDPAGSQDGSPALPHSVFLPLAPEVASWAYAPAVLADRRGSEREEEAAAERAMAEAAAAAADRAVVAAMRRAAEPVPARPPPPSAPYAFSSSFRPSYAPAPGPAPEHRYGQPASYGPQAEAGRPQQRAAEPSWAEQVRAGDSWRQPSRSMGPSAPSSYAGAQAHRAVDMSAVEEVARSDEAVAAMLASHLEVLRRAEAALGPGTSHGPGAWPGRTFPGAWAPRATGDPAAARGSW